MTKRKEAMQWWNELSSLRKTQICDTNTELVGSVRRWETLTGREIEMLNDKLQYESNNANVLLGAVLLTNFENMIEIIKEQVKMPSLSTERRFQKICVNNKWEVIDTHNENKTRYKGAYEDVMIACHNLNKKFYRDGVI